MTVKSTFHAAAAMLVMAPILSNAHMIMKSPVPIGNPSKDPFRSDGSDYPCKGLSTTGGTINPFPVGSQQLLEFTGTAVHGGGSCQLQVTTDKEPTKDSIWKAIYSIEGGCPSTVEGNLVEPQKPDSFPFTVPPELPNGIMTFRFAWGNRVGVREWYGNCAVIEVSGGADDTVAFEALPDGAVANLNNIPGSADCHTKEGFDYRFPDPGKYGVTAGKGPFVDLCTGEPVNGPSFGSDSSPQQPQAPQQSSAPPQSQVPAQSSPATAPGTSSQTPAASSSAPVAPSQSSAALESPTIPSTLLTIVTVTASVPPFQNTSSTAQVAQPTSTPAKPSQGLPSTGTGDSCSPDGSIICNGPNDFGLCNFGKVVFQSVAEGTNCVNGAIVGAPAVAQKREYVHRN